MRQQRHQLVFSTPIHNHSTLLAPSPFLSEPLCLFKGSAVGLKRWHYAQRNVILPLPLPSTSQIEQNVLLISQVLVNWSLATKTQRKINRRDVT